MNVVRTFALILLFAAAPCVQAQGQVEIISLKHTTTDRVIPLLQPMLDRDGAITGMQNQLIIRTSRENLAQLMKVLETLDRAPRRLLISVRQDADGASSSRSVGVAGAARIGNGVIGNGVIAGATGSIPQQGGGAVVIGNNRVVVGGVAGESTANSNERIAQQVQVLEGGQALIQAGQSVPVPSRTVRQTVNGVTVTDSVEYRDLTTGFYVVPRLNGDVVTLEINPQRVTPGNYGPGSANVQRVVTTVSGRLGQWIELGGIDQNSASQNGQLLGGGNSVSTAVRRVLVRVEEIR